MIKKILRVLLILLFVISGISLIYFGLYFSKIYDAKYVYKNVIDIFTGSIDKYFIVDDKYVLGDTFTVTGTANFNLSSQEYQTKAITDINYLHKLNMINNLSNMNVNYSFSQDKKNKKLYCDLDEKIGSETIFNGKYIIDDSTRYFSVNSILENFINDGNNNYFELFSEDVTTEDNIKYLYDIIKISLANRMALESSYYDVVTDISGKNEKVKELSVIINDKSYKRIMNGILSDLRNDSRAKDILISIDKDFEKRKIDNNENVLSKNERYTFNIYLSKYLYKPLKYEIIYLNNNKTKSLSYVGNGDKGTFYYLKDNTLKNRVLYKSSGNKTIIELFDNFENKQGDISIRRDVNSIMLDMDVFFNNKKYEVVYSSNNIMIDKNKKYNREKKLSLKITNNNIIEIMGEIDANDEVVNTSMIDVDTSKAVLRNSLTDIQNNNLNNLKKNIENRLKSY